MCSCVALAKKMRLSRGSHDEKKTKNVKAGSWSTEEETDGGKDQHDGETRTV